MSRHEGPSAGCVFLATGDLDGDGNVDIACHNRNEWPNKITVYHGDGRGGIRSLLSLETQAGIGQDFKDLKIGDVTGDGRLDLVVTATTADHFYVFPSNGNAGFLPAVAYAHPPSPSNAWPASLQVVDLDHDGINEVVTVNAEEAPHARLNIYRRSSNGGLVLSQQRSVHSSTSALLAGDVGGDGDLDLVLGHWGFGVASVLGEQDAGLATERRYELPGFGNDVAYTLRHGHANALALGDLNGDACNDLVAATHSGIILLYGCRPYATSLPVSDFDGDGVSDLFWRQQQAPVWMHLWLWADRNSPCPAPCPPFVEGDWIGQAVGDFDGDGSSDVFWRSPSNGENHVSLKGFYLRRGQTVANQDWQVAGAGDFDGDDRSDLFWRNRRTGENVIWRSALSETPTPEVPVSDQNWQVVAVGDFNGDGRSDLVWRHATNGRNNIWWSGRSAGVHETIQVGNLQWRVFGAGDFDEDGKDDLVWRNIATGEGILWYSADHRTQGILTTVFDLDWQIAAVADYNGDAISDLLWRHRLTGANIIWWSGSSHFQKELVALDPSFGLVR